MRHRLTVTALLACLCGPALSANLDAQMAAIDKLADTDPASAMAKLDALAAQSAHGPVADLNAVQEERCSLLARDNLPAVLRLVEKELATPKIDPAHGARMRVCRGAALVIADKWNDALPDFEFGVADGIRRHDQDLLAQAQAYRGEVRANAGQYAGAIDDLRAAYGAAIAANNKDQQLYILNAIANLYADSNVKDYDNALQYYYKLLAAHQANKDATQEASTYFNIASTLESQDKLPQAQENFRLALKLEKQRGALPTDIAVDERALAVVLSKQGKHAEALQLLDHAMVQYRKANDADGIATVQLSRAAALRRAARFAAAESDIEGALAYFQHEHNQRYLDKIYEERALIEAGIGNWREAYAAQVEKMKIAQGLQQQLMDERTTRLRVQFHTEQEQRNNQLLARENAAQQQALAAADASRRWQWAALVFSLIALAALGVMTLREIRLRRRMQDLALTDELTRLPNRRHFMALANDAVANAHKQHTAQALAAIDIDHFKYVNDTYGHAAGDAVLQRVSHAARMALRPGDTIGRTGGEEFLVLLPGTAEEDALHVAERIRAAVSALNFDDIAPALRVSVSIGVAACQGSADTMERMCQRADAALYAAKANGRDRVELATA